MAAILFVGFVVLGLLMSTVVVNVAGRQKSAMVSATRASEAAISTAAKLYEVDTGHLPASLDDLTKSDGSPNWNGPYLEGGKVPRDSWGQPFKYEVKGDQFEVKSEGAERAGAGSRKTIMEGKSWGRASGKRAKMPPPAPPPVTEFTLDMDGEKSEKASGVTTVSGTVSGNGLIGDARMGFFYSPGPPSAESQPDSTVSLQDKDHDGMSEAMEETGAGVPMLGDIPVTKHLIGQAAAESAETAPSAGSDKILAYWGDAAGRLASGEPPARRDAGPPEDANMRADTSVGGTPSTASAASPTPADFDSVAVVKSPVIRRLYARRSPDGRGAAIAGSGGGGEAGHEKGLKEVDKIKELRRGEDKYRKASEVVDNRDINGPVGGMFEPAKLSADHKAQGTDQSDPNRIKVKTFNVLPTVSERFSTLSADEGEVAGRVGLDMRDGSDELRVKQETAKNNEAMNIAGLASAAPPPMSPPAAVTAPEPDKPEKPAVSRPGLIAKESYSERLRSRREVLEGEKQGVDRDMGVVAAEESNGWHGDRPSIETEAAFAEATAAQAAQLGLGSLGRLQEPASAEETKEEEPDVELYDFVPNDLPSETVAPSGKSRGGQAGENEKFNPQTADFDSVAITKSPVVMRGVYGSRSSGMRASALAGHGGSGSTEIGQARSLRWLKKNQGEDGLWNGKVEDTSVSLLAYLAHGETPASEEFGGTTEKAIKALLAAQRPDGRFSDDPDVNAKAAYALNEAYGLTRIPIVREAAEKATGAVIENQEKLDKISGWQASALKSAAMAGIGADGLAAAKKDAVEKLKKTEGAGAALGLQLLGHGKDAGTRDKLQALTNAQFELKADHLDDMFFTTQAKFHAGGADWKAWNAQFAPAIVKSQTIIPKATQDVRGRQVDLGYWNLPGERDKPSDDVYNTAIASLMGTVYYRYLPTYKHPEEAAPEQDEDVLEEVLPAEEKAHAARAAAEEQARQEAARQAEQARIEAEKKAREEAEAKAEADLSGPRFKAFGVNPFIPSAQQPFSTFSIDVDSASYTLARNYMNRGYLPPAEAVRTEEFVNFFDYGYKAPENETFRIYVEGAPSRFGHGLQLLKIGVKGKRLGREEQRPAVLTFLVDTSGSMNQPDRLDLAKKSLRMLVERLAPRDRVAIVQYDSHARLVLESTPASEKKAILDAIDSLQCSGSTNLQEGMERAYGMAARSFAPKGENRVLLLSDGVANLGTLAAEDILKRVDSFRKQGVFLSVFGVGMGAYDDTMLQALANKGDGVYSFIDSEAEAKRVLVDDMAASLNTIGKDVKIQVEFNPSRVKQYRQLGYEKRQLKKEDFRNDAVDAGEIGSGQSVTALYEMQVSGARNQEAGGRRQEAGVEASVQPSAGQLPQTDVTDWTTGGRSEWLGVVRVRYRRTDSGRVEEIERPITSADMAPSFDQASARFRLAAAAAEFAEILRGSPFAEGVRVADVAEVLRPVAMELSLDGQVQELSRLVQQTEGMGRGDL